VQARGQAGYQTVQGLGKEGLLRSFMFVNRKVTHLSLFEAFVIIEK